ncbi:MAG TPA: hypothetical protein PK665_15070 [Ignavibacteriaceae bacterium]|nr:hypothetical protein [Ignavibacteriaceae bacterium]
MMDQIINTKSKRKRELSLYEFYDRLLLMNQDNYLLSYDEACKMLRIDRNKFVKEYIESGKLPITLREDGRKMIRNLDLKLYLDQQQRIYQA